MIDHNQQDKSGFNYTLTSGENLKLAVCADKASELLSTARKGNLQFFTQNSKGVRRQLNSNILTNADLAMFETGQSTSINISNCFTIPYGFDVKMQHLDGKNAYFGFRINPYCQQTGTYCL